MQILFFIVLLMKCPYCKESIKSGSLKCKHCHADLASEEAKSMIKESNKMSPLLKWGGWFLLVMFVIGAIASWGSQSVNNTTTQSSSIAIPQYAPNTWVYNTRDDKLSWKSIYTASIVANEKLYFEFPYAGWQDATLILRHNGPDNNDVILTISKWQFIWSYNSSLNVRFDEWKVETIWFNEPSDSSSDAIFIKWEAAFIAKLKKAKKVAIEATFYNNWNHTMVFNVEWVKF